MDTVKQKFISHFLFVGEQCGKAEEAITFYMSLFKNSHLLHIERWSEGENKEEAAGTVKLARFSLNGQEFQAQDSGRQHAFTFTPALSIFVQCETEPEIDGLFQSFLKAARFSCLSVDIRSAKSLVGLRTNTAFHGN